VGSTKQTLARAWSVAFYDHPAAPDGIIYSSRLNEDTNVAVYDRATPKLNADRSFNLIEAPGFASFLNTLKVASI
jgi:hypothetical protein